MYFLVKISHFPFFFFSSEKICIPNSFPFTHSSVNQKDLELTTLSTRKISESKMAEKKNDRKIALQSAYRSDSGKVVQLEKISASSRGPGTDKFEALSQN
jgi:hypothetical protein